MKKISFLVLGLASLSVTAFPADRHIAFERNQAVWSANLDGTGEKKVADGISPAISPDGTRIAFNTTEKTSDTTYARHIAVIDVGTGKIDVSKMSRAIIRITRAGRLTGNKSFSLRVLTKSGILPW